MPTTCQTLYFGTGAAGVNAIPSLACEERSESKLFTKEFKETGEQHQSSTDTEAQSGGQVWMT